MSSNKPISLTIFQPAVQQIIALIKLAEQKGIKGIWLPSLPGLPDPLPILAAAAVQTERIQLGSGIVVTYPRHPLALVNEALALAELAPGRFRLGIGASHPFIVEETYGIPFGKPLAHLREYTVILRDMLWKGRVNFRGSYYQVKAELPPYVTPPRLPIIMATVRPKMFRLAGELSDGAMVSWGPLSYLIKTAIPAMQAGAQAAGRPRPPLIASAPIIFDSDFAHVRQAALGALKLYSTVPAYIEMFALAGFPLSPNGAPADELIHELFLYGDADTIQKRLVDMLAADIDEIQVMITPVKDPVAEGGAIMEILSRLG